MSKKKSSSSPESEAAFEAPPFDVDRPKQHLAEDRLGYSDFARAVARSIAGMTSTDGVVMAIHGPWGSGKTSAVNMIVEALSQLLETEEEKDRVVTVRFNPWWFSEQRDLTLSFFTEVSAGLGHKVSSAVKSALLGLAKRVMGSKDILMSAMAFAPGGEALKQLLAEAFGFLGEKGAAEHSVEQVRKELEAALVNEGKRVLVIIDDVDRLPADEARQIFRLVKSVADLPNITYLLVFDRRIAEEALKPLATGDGSHWLEKIVQISIDLPPAPLHDLQKLFFEGASKILGEAELGNNNYWGNIFFDVIAPKLRTPRDVARLLNALAVTWPAVKGEVNIPDFLAIETLRLFERDLYTIVRTDFPDIIGSDSSLFGSRRQAIGEKILSLSSGDRHTYLKGTISRMFPQMASAWNGHDYHSADQTSWDKEKRICSPRRFQTYFAFGISDETLSQTEIDTFLSKIDDRAYVIERVRHYSNELRRRGGTRAAVLLTELQANLDAIPDTKIAQAAGNLIFAGDDFLRPEDDRQGGLNMPAVWGVGAAINPLLRRLPPEERFDVLLDAVQNSSSLATLNFIISMASDKHGRPGRDDIDPKPPEERLLEEGPLRELERALAQRLAAAAEDGSLLDNSHATALITGWCDCGGEADARSWIAGRIGDDDFVIALASIVTGTGAAYGSGDRVGMKFFRISRELIERLIGLDTFMARVTEIDARTDLSPKAKETISNFLAGAKSRR